MPNPILTRKPGQSIVIDGRIVVTFLGRPSRGKASIDIGISAPADVPVMRQELLPLSASELIRQDREASDGL